MRVTRIEPFHDLGQLALECSQVGRHLRGGHVENTGDLDLHVFQAGLASKRPHLVDHVIPHVPVRQWVLSLPIPVRVLLAAQPELVTPVLQVVQRVVTRHFEQKGFAYSA